MTYDECIKAMFGLRRFGIKLGLDVIANLLDGLKNPQEYLKIIHIAGTNGKGSIAAFLAAILESAGIKVGVYTSPHLVRFNERITVNNLPVSDEEVVESYLAVHRNYSGDREPTFFEYATAMALYLFHKNKVEWTILETGMGGRLDATNFVNPELSIISNISLEHTSYLGKTISAIAYEKAGIIKPHVPVVSGVQQKSARNEILRSANHNSAPVYFWKEHFKTRRTAKNKFTYYGLAQTLTKLQTSLIGSHQLGNAALALAACELLNQKQIQISENNFREGLASAKWPGRLEIVQKEPLVILDGAHNLDACKKLAAFLNHEFKGRHVTLVIGILDDKPYDKMLGLLAPSCQRIIITAPEIERALHPDKILPHLQSFSGIIKIIPQVPDAIQYAVDTSQKTDVICIAGSLYVIGEAKPIFDKEWDSRHRLII